MKRQIISKLLMDSLLLIGQTEPKLKALLSKLGYNLLQPSEQVSIPELMSSNTVDLIVIDARLDQSWGDLCEFLRSDSAAKKIPLVYIPNQAEGPNTPAFDPAGKFEVLSPASSPASISTRIATQIRLRKIDGADLQKASIAEANAALRDLNHRLKKEREEARSIQMSLLPGALPENSKYQVAVEYRPLDEVGGDWYFAQETPDAKLAVQVADITGHGLSAALICSMTKMALAAAETYEPHTGLYWANRLLTPQLPEGRFVTMAALLYDPDSGTVQFSRAGHPPCLWLSRTQKQVKWIQTDGFPIGLLPEADYGFDQFTMEPGDCAVLFTDGITEGQNRGRECYGMDRLVSALSSTPEDLSAEHVLKAILNDFQNFHDGRILKDDLTLVVLKRQS